MKESQKRRAEVDGIISPWVRHQYAERGKAPIANDHRIIEEGSQEAAIGAFLLAHEGHTQDVEIQRGTWTIYCRCARCEDIRTYEVDNEAREQAIGLPPWQEEDRKLE